MFSPPCPGPDSSTASPHRARTTRRRAAMSSRSSASCARGSGSPIPARSPPSSAPRQRFFVLATAREPLFVYVRLPQDGWLEVEVFGDLGPFSWAADRLLGRRARTDRRRRCFYAILREGRAIAGIAVSVERFAATGSVQPPPARGSPETAALARGVFAMQRQVAGPGPSATTMPRSHLAHIKTYVQRLKLRLDLGPTTPNRSAKRRAISTP